MILKNKHDMKNDIIKMSQGWEAEIFEHTGSSDITYNITQFLLDEIFTYIENSCELEETK